MRRIRAFGLSALLIAAWAVGSGCGKDSDRPEYREISGRITAIDLESGVVSMSYYNDKHKRNMTLSGRLAPNAQILINGTTARKEDLEIGDRVRVTGREEKGDGDRQLVAMQVDVMRLGPPSSEASTSPGDDREVSGRLERVDLEAGVVSISYHDDEQKREVSIEGTVAPDAQIQIDDAAALLKDLRAEDRVTVTWREEAGGDEHRIIVTKISVTRHPPG